MARMPKKTAKYVDVIWRMRNSYYPSRHAMSKDEQRTIELALKTKMITDRKILLMLKSFDFDVGEIPSST